MGESPRNIGAESDPRIRSLLQKAVRRGHADLVMTIAAMLADRGAKGRDWFRTRTAVITFGENWPLGTALTFGRGYPSKVAAMVRLALTEKHRDATGLADLARALSKGDRSPLEGSEADRDIKIVANGILRPQPFWQWVQSEAETDRQQHFVANALRFRRAGTPRDQAVTKAAAYLALKGPFPEVRRVLPNREAFPYWTVLDVHTPQGKRVMKDIARDLFIPLPQLEWALFFFEGTRTNASAPSAWWDRCCRWHFQKIGLPAAEAHLLWDPVKPQVIEALREDSHRLHRQLYAWKLDHRAKVDALQGQVDAYLANEEDGGQGYQRTLFDARPP